MSFAGFGYAAANALLNAKADAGDGWMKAIGEVADVLVRPEILQVSNMDKDPDFMTVFGCISPQAPMPARNNPPFAIAL